jgi:hypothetical protein
VAIHQWQICADGNTYRPVCHKCDLDLNELVLRWAGFPEHEVEELMTAYRAREL